MGESGNTGLGAPELAANEELRSIAAGAATLAEGGDRKSVV